MKLLEYFSKFLADTGDFAEKRAGRKPKIKGENLKDKITAILFDYYTISIDNIRDKLPDSLKVDKSSISSTLKNMEWTKKKIRQFAKERKAEMIIETRNIYASIVSIRKDSDLISMDETGMNLHCGPNFGSAPT